MIKIIYFIFIFLIFAGCSKAPNDSKFEKTFSNKTISKSYHLKGKKYYFEQIVRPFSILDKGDYLVVGESRRIDPDYPPLHIIEKRNMEYQTSKGQTGFGPGEIPDILGLDVGLGDSTFWVNSGMSKSLSEFQLEGNALAIRRIKLEEALYMALHAVWSSDSTLVCRMVADPYRFVEFHVDGTRLGEFGLWRDILVRDDLNDYMMADLHLGSMKGNSKKGIYATAGGYRDRIEILKDRQIITVDGPESRIPDFTIISGPGQSPSLIIDLKEPLHYMDVFVGDNYIYGLYSGRTEKEIAEGDVVATRVFGFDHSGNVLFELLLDTSVRNFVVDEKHGKIYGVSTDRDPGIVVFELDRLLAKR